MTLLTGGKWIWLEQDQEIPHQYACLRRKFIVSAVDAEAFVEISVDSDFVLYINEREVVRGQFSDYPERKTFTRVNVAEFLNEGENVVAILAYYRGEDFFEYRKGRPGLAFAIANGDQVIKSDTSWKAVQHPAFKSGAIPRVTGQMGFTTCFDARLDLPWLSCGFDDSEWPYAETQLASLFGSISERPLKPLLLHPETPVKVITQGSVRRGELTGSYAKIMSSSYLETLPARDVFKLPPPSDVYEAFPLTASDLARVPDENRLEVLPVEDADGRFITVSVEREEVGLLTFDIDAPAGTILDIGHGEHMDDGRVRMWVGGRNFADRYICREGVNRFTLPFRRLGARYIEMHIIGFSRPVLINYIGMRPIEFEVDDKGTFASSDSLADKTYIVGKRTLALCMHEHYEDCPWREQALYGYDSRNQALYGYHGFGNYDFAAASFDLLGKGIRDDGLLELCAPSRASITIPIFSLVWMNSVAEHWLYSGNSVLFDTFGDQIRFMIEKALEGLDAETGVYVPLSGKEYWDFYEWMDGLAGTIGGEPIEGRLDAPYNLFLHESIGSYAWMLEKKGLLEEARKARITQKELGASIVKTFWNEEKKLVSTCSAKGEQYHYADLVQMLALNQGILPESAVQDVMKTLYREELYPMTISSRVYEVRTLMDIDSQTRRFVDDRIYRDWGGMLYKGATSFWETAFGGDDFDLAGSLCHGWSALPTYYFGAYALGVIPTEPGFKKFKVKPYPGRLSHANGSVPTPAGEIHIDWKWDGQGLSIEATGPDSLQPEVESWPEYQIVRFVWNGAKII